MYAVCYDFVVCLQHACRNCVDFLTSVHKTGMRLSLYGLRMGLSSDCMYWVGRDSQSRAWLTSLWNLSRVSFLSIWSNTHGLHLYCPPSSKACQQFPALRSDFTSTTLNSLLSSVGQQKKDDGQLEVRIWGSTRCTYLMSIRIHQQAQCQRVYPGAKPEADQITVLARGIPHVTIMSSNCMVTIAHSLFWQSLLASLWEIACEYMKAQASLSTVYQTCLLLIVLFFLRGVKF